MFQKQPIVGSNNVEEENKEGVNRRMKRGSVLCYEYALRFRCGYRTLYDDQRIFLSQSIPTVHP